MCDTNICLAESQLTLSHLPSTFSFPITTSTLSKGTIHFFKKNQTLSAGNDLETLTETIGFFKNKTVLLRTPRFLRSNIYSSGQITLDPQNFGRKQQEKKRSLFQSDLDFPHETFFFAWYKYF